MQSTDFIILVPFPSKKPLYAVWVNSSPGFDAVQLCSPISQALIFTVDFTVLLGSIPEMPAKSCKEIKASAGERAVSGEYWLDSVVPWKTVAINCNMETVGE